MDLSLKAGLRKTTGKGNAIKLRHERNIPGILYGESKPGQAVVVQEAEVEQILQQGGIGKVIRLHIAGPGGEESQAVLVKDVQRDPVKRNLLHVDFWRIAMDQPVRVKVPLNFEHEEDRVRDGAFLQMVLHELDISCLPRQIPDTIRVDVSGVTSEKALMVKDLVLPEELRVLNPPEEVVVQATFPPNVEEPAESQTIPEGDEAESEN